MKSLFLALLLVSSLGRANAESLEVIANSNVAFLDDYAPVEVPVTSATTVSVVSSDMCYRNGDPASRVDQVVIWYVTYGNPCGYFWVISAGTSQQLPFSNGTAKLFVVEGGDTSDNSGSAAIRIGNATVIVDAILNAVPLTALNAASLTFPPGTEVRASVTSSTVSLGSEIVMLNKALLYDSGSQSSTGWLHTLCVGDTPVDLPAMDLVRVVFACIVDHQQILDNWGTLQLLLDTRSVVPTEGTTWGELKSSFR